jgi:hypothetical protein
MTPTRFFVGLDVGSEHFSATLAKVPWHLAAGPHRFENNPAGFAALVAWLRTHPVEPRATVCVLEATGV